MRLWYSKHCVLFLFLFGVGCALYGERKPEVVPLPKPSAQREDSREDLQERSQKLQLQKATDEWEGLLTTNIASLHAEIRENESIIQEGLFTENQEDIVKRNKKLFSYLEALKRIRRLNQQLNEKDTALSREIIYRELIDHYLSCLRLVEAAREREYAYEGDTQSIRKEIENNYHSDNFYTVIKFYNYLARNKKGEGKDVKSQVYAALSLARLGWAEDAMKMVEEALQEEYSITCGNAPLFYELGEWLIDRERYELAQNIFKRIALYYQTEEEWHRKAKKKVELFRTGQQSLMARNKIDQAFDLYEKNGNFSEAYLLCLEARENCTDLDCQEEVQTFLDQLIVRGVADIEEKLQEIDTRIEESNLLEAQRLLITLKESFSGEAYPPPITEKQLLIREKEEFLQEKEAEWKDELDRQKLEKANELLESGHYEEAVALFDQFRGTPYQIEVETKKQLAIDRLAREKRVKAGQFFLQAKHSEDPELRRTYLIESYNLLKGIIDNYPNNSYAEKIRKNLEDVRSEIEKVYPEFFMQPEPSDSGSLSGLFEGEETISQQSGAPLTH